MSRPRHAGATERARQARVRLILKGRWLREPPAIGVDGYVILRLRLELPSADDVDRWSIGQGVGHDVPTYELTPLDARAELWDLRHRGSGFAFWTAMSSRSSTAPP